MDNIEYLAFVDMAGTDSDGNNIYRLDFTIDPDAVWGEHFNITPAGIVPDLQPDRNSLSSTATISVPYVLELAKRNNCFSMQDCIDGIIPLGFCRIGEDGGEIDGKPFYIMFGEPIDGIIGKLSAMQISLIGKREIERGDDTAIDKIIESISDDGEIDEDNFE